ncbi:GbsR/MarR family transcriptional regulator [Streptomyces sp. NPDC004838]
MTEQPMADAAYERDDAVLSVFVERFAAQLAEAGMPRMAARVFAAILVSDSGALTAAELAERLKISAAGVSGAVRYLAQVNMVSREREPGSRRERYRVHMNQWYEALTNRDQMMKRWEDTMREGVVAVGPDSPAGRRLAETEEFFAFLREELSPLLERWRKRQEGVSGPE